MSVVTLMTRATCGSCARVEAQIRPIAARFGAEVEIVDVDAGGERVQTQLHAGGFEVGMGAVRE